MFKVELKLGWIFERQGLVCFVEQRDFNDTGIEDLINEKLLRISGTRWAKSMSEDGTGIRTRPIKCEHTVTHYCFIDIEFFKMAEGISGGQNVVQKLFFMTGELRIEEVKKKSVVDINQLRCVH